MASQAAAQARFAEQTERGLLERLRAAEAARADATEHHQQALARTTTAEAALRTAREATAQQAAIIQGLQARLQVTEQQMSASQVGSL